MLVRRWALNNAIKTSRMSWRCASNETKEGSRRFMQTTPKTTPKPEFYGGFKYMNKGSNAIDDDKKWSKHTLSAQDNSESKKDEVHVRSRRSRTTRFQNKNLKSVGSSHIRESENDAPSQEAVANEPTITIAQEPKIPDSNSNKSKVPEKSSGVNAVSQPKKRRTLKPRKALITLSPSAVKHLKGLLNQPDPKMIRIGVKNRGCSGLTYNLEYVSEPGKFDETIEQDGVKVLIDSKALFSIVGSEMDWLDDKLSSRFIFKNPNSKGTCGCGESFMV
ncbi:uncharacterized protein PRCAT00003260001 [Priceomyces carsonii]|uniref:uncharacterized protein n=1 Tax=Priceomyces carsonii TaxID=28549 RepID=UPI002ED9B99A|nr:unnamed protein product [Priceomyces carsonii]